MGVDIKYVSPLSIATFLSGGWLTEAAASFFPWEYATNSALTVCERQGDRSEPDMVHAERVTRAFRQASGKPIVWVGFLASEARRIRTCGS